MSAYLGIDSSTQGIKAVVIEIENGRIIGEASVNFGRDFPQHNSPAGFLPNDNPLVRQASPLMWLDGLELVLKRLAEAGIHMQDIKGISGAGQQHGTVYLKGTFEENLAGLTPGKSLSEQIAPCLSRKVSPIWMDRSTSDECTELRETFGDRLQRDTGSPACERFSGPQIRRFFKQEPEAYTETAVIHLVSSFLCSVLIGKNAPIDYGDGAGMNLLNLHSLQWDEEIAEYTAPGLLKKLPVIAESASVAGTLHPYFAKYGLKPGIKVASWTGDNPSSLIGTGAGLPGYAGISLGTSDTFFGKMTQFKTDPEGCGHVFGHPAGGFMSLICFTNGSLAREHVKEECQASWDYFDVQSCLETKPGNNGCYILPYYEPESTPLCLTPQPRPNFDWKKASSACRIRAILESQALAMRLHSRWLNEPIQAICLTGGASKSPSFQQIIADVFQAPVLVSDSTNACGLGGAMRAANACGGFSFETLNVQFCKSSKSIPPHPENRAIYEKALEMYRQLEDER